MSKEDQQEMLALLRVLAFQIRMNKINGFEQIALLEDRRRLLVEYPFEALAWYLQIYGPKKTLFEADLLSTYYHRLLILAAKVGAELQAQSQSVQEFAESFVYVLVQCFKGTPGFDGANATETPFYQAATKLVSSIEILKGV